MGMLQKIHTGLVLLIGGSVFLGGLWFVGTVFFGTRTPQATPASVVSPRREAPTPSSGNGRQEWLGATPESRRSEVARILRNCETKFSTDYYVRQLDDFYSAPSTAGVRLYEALALIGAGVGDEWKCS